MTRIILKSIVKFNTNPLRGRISFSLHQWKHTDSRFHPSITLSTPPTKPRLEAKKMKPSKFQLSYFNIRGDAEGSRLLFAIAEEDYDDTRFDFTLGTMDSPSFTSAKEAGLLTMNLDRVPVLITPEGSLIGQSKAIERFLARRFGLMGSNETEAAFIDCIAEHCRDVEDAQAKKRFSMFVKDRTDDEKKQAEKEWFETDMPALLTKIEASLKEGGAAKGRAVGSSISYADVSIFSLLKDCYPPYKEATRKATKECPLLLEICESVASNPKVSKWIEQRPFTTF